MGLLSRSSKRTESVEGNGTAPQPFPADPEKDAGTYDDSPVKFLTTRSLMMGVLVSMGGFIFGYDTGQCFGGQARTRMKLKE